MKRQQIEWLPENKHQAENLAALMSDYAFKSTSFTLYPFADSKSIDLDVIESWLQSINVLESNPKNIFLGSCFIAFELIKERQCNADGFSEMWWQDKNGYWSKELHLFSPPTEECCVFSEQLS